MVWHGMAPWKQSRKGVGVCVVSPLLCLNGICAQGKEGEVKVRGSSRVMPNEWLLPAKGRNRESSLVTLEAGV